MKMKERFSPGYDVIIVGVFEVHYTNNLGPMDSRWYFRLGTGAYYQWMLFDKQPSNPGSARLLALNMLRISMKVSHDLIVEEIAKTNAVSLE